MPSPIAAQAHAQDGCELSYRIHGQPGKPRLVLIHSLALDAGIWDQVVAELAGDGEILLYDCRGHGESERRPGDYTVELFASDLASILDACGWSSAVVAGCSMGGCVAQAFGAAYPKRALALALIDTTSWYGPDATAYWQERAATAMETGLAAMLSLQLSRWLGDAFRARHPEIVEEVSRVFLANDVSCYQSSCALLGSVDLRAAIRSLRMPVSVIVGEEDPATPLAVSQAIQAAIPGSTLEVIRQARHLTPIERPAEIAATLRNLLTRASASGP